jgi:acyl-CoA synthetase (AMP-forming)/AMP-acid ligase II
MTYADLAVQIETVARDLASAGFGRGDRIAVALPHGPEFAVAILALCCALTCAPLNDQLTDDVLAQLLARMRIDALVVLEGAETSAAQAARRLAIPVLELRVLPDAPAGTFELLLQSRREPVEIHPPAPHDVALLVQTSGTTGRPKILRFEHWLLAESARNRVDVAAIEPTDRYLAVVPFYASVAIRRGLLPALIVGGSVICPTALDAVTLVSVLEGMQPTQLLAPPVVQIAMLEAFERRHSRPAHALRFISSSFTELDPAMRRRLEIAFGIPVVVSYGMAECGSIAETPMPPDQAPPQSVGRPTLLDVAIADAAGRLLGHGEVGEIVVRGPEVVSGYEGDDEANLTAFREGWFRTGDAGRIDHEGFVYLVGRIKDVINRGGNKIAPAEVEDALRQHPQVADAAVFAMPHPTLGEDVVAAVVSRYQGLTEAELRRFASGALPTSHMPSRILPLAELPRDALGKVSRVELARIAERAMTAKVNPPATSAEAEVSRIFSEVLNVPAVGRSGNFFHLGGDSLRAEQVLAEIEAVFGVRMHMGALFDHPTAAEFAAELASLLASDAAEPSHATLDKPHSASDERSA